MKKFFKTHAKLCIAVLALALVTVGGTLALMAVSSNSVTNSFTTANIDTEIKEDLSAGKQVSITNKGDSDAYVRARIMVSGVSKEQVEIVLNEPTKEDLAEEVNTDKVFLVMKHIGTKKDNWSKETVGSNSGYSDDYYYYLDVLKANTGKTSNLLEKVVLGDSLAKDQDFLSNFTVTVYHESVLAINQPEEITLDVVKSAFDAVQSAATT